MNELKERACENFPHNHHKQFGSGWFPRGKILRGKSKIRCKIVLRRRRFLIVLPAPKGKESLLTPVIVLFLFLLLYRKLLLLFGRRSFPKVLPRKMIVTCVDDFVCTVDFIQFNKLSLLLCLHLRYTQFGCFSNFVSPNGSSILVPWLSLRVCIWGHRSSKA